MKKEYEKLYSHSDCMKVADEIAGLYNAILDKKEKLTAKKGWKLENSSIDAKLITFKTIARRERLTNKQPKKGISETLIRMARTLEEEVEKKMWRVAIAPTGNAPSFETDSNDILDALKSLRKKYLDAAMKDLTSDFLLKSDYKPYVDYDDYH